MTDERLLEITSKINSLDGPLQIVSYFTSLKEQEITEFIEILNSRGYSSNGMNIVDAIITFSQDYVNSCKGVKVR